MNNFLDFKSNEVYLGKHLIIDIYGVSFDIANNLQFLKEIIQEVIQESNINKIQEYYYSFTPQGCSGIVLISESHISFHTYPEHNIVMFDIFTCGSDSFPEKGLDILVKRIPHSKIEVIENTRGRFDIIPLSEPNSI